MKKKSDFDLSLNFQPTHTWPGSLPAVAIGNDLVAGFELSSDHPTHQHEVKSPEENTKRLMDLYHNLDLSELSRLIFKPRFAALFSEELLLQLNQMGSNPDLKAVLKMISGFSLELQNWISSKKPGYNELSPLLPLSLENQIFVLGQAVKFQESKTLSALRIELLSDLLQMDFSKQDLADLTLENLKKKRYPQTTLRDQKVSLVDLTLPKTVKSRFLRQGDKGGFEIQFFAGTPAELNKTAQLLMKAAESWNSNLEKNS